MIRKDGGSALLEFALLLPVIVLVLVGLFDVTTAVWQTGTLGAAAREGARYAIVHGSDSAAPAGPAADDAGVTGAVLGHAVGVSGVNVSSSWPDGTNERGSRVVVTATATFTPALSQVLLGGGLSVTLRGGSQMVIHR